MSKDSVENLVLEQLRAIRGKLGELKTGQRQTNDRLAATEHHMAGFHVTVSYHQEEIAEIKLRLDQVEKRLQLSD